MGQVIYSHHGMSIDAYFYNFTISSTKDEKNLSISNAGPRKVILDIFSAHRLDLIISFEERFLIGRIVVIVDTSIVQKYVKKFFVMIYF